MKQEKIIFWIDVLITQMNHWALFSAVAALSLILGVTKPPAALWLVCGLLPILFFSVRRYTNGFLIMAGSHILCLILLFLVPIPDRGIKIILCLYGIGWVIYSFLVRLRTKDRLDGEIPPVAAVGIIAVFLFFLHYQKIEKWDMYYAGMIAVYFTCYYMKHYFLHYLHFMTVNESSAGYIPRKEIFTSGTKLTGIFTLFVASVLLLAADIGWVTWIVSQLRSAAIWLRNIILKVLAMLLSQDTQAPVEAEPELQETFSGGMLPEAGETGLLWQILDKIIMTVVPLLFILLLCYGLFRLIKLLRERFRGKQDLMRERGIENSRDIREKYEAEKKMKTHRDFFAFLNPAERIRHIYKQKIWANRNSLAAKGDYGLLQIYTARECGNLLSEELLAQTYEKARYSQEKCTKDDVKRASKGKK